MAGPQFSASGSVRHHRPRRRFTLEQANRSLPLVRRIVTDVVRAHTQVLKLQRELERIAQAAKPPRKAAAGRDRAQAAQVAHVAEAPAQPVADAPAVQAQLEAAVHRLEDYVDELSEIGCDLKDYSAGLIDFIGRHQGRDVCLCWKLGEDRVGYWHELDAGFGGRQPVSTLRETE